ncbi:MAG: DUF3380 domain-containing protein [Rhodocyclaceae bacterium]|nr:DUF3380 domain-containing protein [Rhodocyclaceae bacterium]
MSPRFSTPGRPRTSSINSSRGTTMRKGDTGGEVRDLQFLLTSNGYGVDVDGVFDEADDAAVRAFQAANGMVVDGIAGPRTLNALRGYEGDEKHLTQADIEAAATALEVPAAAIHTIAEVESDGSGFLGDGRPKILFERHQLYRLLKEAGEDADALAGRYPELINPKRGGYRGGSAEWYRLTTARSISTLADQAASWGRFQIMGYHWGICGADSPAAFVAAMGESEGRHLSALVAFIDADPTLHKALKSLKWADFAKLYNGPAYKENLYDAKLAAAYKRHAGAQEVAA